MKMDGSRKYPDPPHRGFQEIPRGRWSLKPKFLKVNMNQNQNFWRDGFGNGGNSNQNKILDRDMDILNN